MFVRVCTYVMYVVTMYVRMDRISTYVYSYVCMNVRMYIS